MKNFDSVPQLQATTLQLRASLRYKIASWLTFASMSLTAALLQCGPAGHGFSVLVQQLQDQSPEPVVWTVEGVLSLTERVALGFSGGGALRPLLYCVQVLSLWYSDINIICTQVDWSLFHVTSERICSNFAWYNISASTLNILIKDQSTVIKNAAFLYTDLEISKYLSVCKLDMF